MYDGPAGADALAAAVELVRSRPARLGATHLVAVDGPSGSGKTTFAPQLADALGREFPEVRVVSTDLLATWEDPLGWWPILEEHLLAPIARGHAARMPVVAWVSGVPRPGGVLDVPPTDVLVLEGVSAGRAAVSSRLTALIWVEVTEASDRLERAVARDGELMRPYLERWQHDEAAHFERDGTRLRADIVIHPD